METNKESNVITCKESMKDTNLIIIENKSLEKIFKAEARKESKDNHSMNSIGKKEFTMISDRKRRRSHSMDSLIDNQKQMKKGLSSRDYANLRVLQRIPSVKEYTRDEKGRRPALDIGSPTGPWMLKAIGIQFMESSLINPETEIKLVKQPVEKYSKETQSSECTVSAQMDEQITEDHTRIKDE